MNPLTKYLDSRYDSTEPPDDFNPEPMDFTLVPTDADYGTLGDELSAYLEHTMGKAQGQGAEAVRPPSGAFKENPPLPKWDEHVPFKRELHMNMHGPDVRALQRALHKAGYRHREPTAKYQELTERQVKRFQRHHGIHKDRGVVHQNTWEHLWPWMDGYDRYLCSHVHKPRPHRTPLERFVHIAWRYYYARPMHYLQQRPMQGVAKLPAFDTSLDCSEFVYACALNAGLPDPSGYVPGFMGYGNTYSYLWYLPHTSNPQRGDLVFYDNPSHVGIIVGAVRGMLYSIDHGSEGGPFYHVANYRTPTAYRTFRGLAGVS